MAPRDANPVPLNRGPSLNLALVLILVLAGVLGYRLVTRVAHQAAGVGPAPMGQFAATDARGHAVALARPPQRIVSLTPANTETLYALGLGPRLVADTDYCDYPPEARALPHVGGADISVEKVLAQRPDLVLASASANSKVIGPIEAVGVPVFAIDPHNVLQTLTAIGEIGRLTGTGRQARRLTAMMLNSIQRMRTEAAHAAGHPRVLVILTADPLWVAGSGSFLDELVTMAGGVNVARDAGPGYRPYSPERVVAANPSVIVVLGPRSDLGRIVSRPGWRHLAAVERHAVYVGDADILTRPGPRLPQGLSALVALFHSDRAHTQ